MNPDALAVLIPVIAIGGFFAWRIALAFTGAYTAKLNAQGQAAPGLEEVRGAIEELRREVAELAERVDFVERLQARPRDAGRLAPP